MLRKIRKNYRRLVAFMLTVAMAFTNLNVAFASGEEQEALFLIDGEGLWEAIESAVESGETFRFSSLELKAKSRKLKSSYEKLIGGKSGQVYRLDMDVDERYAPENASVEVFYNAGTEDVIFLFINESDMIVKFRVDVDGYDTVRVIVNPNTANVEDAEASYVEDYSNAIVVDDVPHTLGAEVLNPTTGAADADEETEAGAEEISEAEAGDSYEITAVESEAEESKADEDETVEDGGTKEAGENVVVEVEETTQASNDVASETEESKVVEAVSEAVVAEDAETTAEISEIGTDTDDQTPDAESTDEDRQETTSEEENMTASISIRRLQQVASSITNQDNAEATIDQEDIQKDETEKIQENSEAEDVTEEMSSAADEEEAQPSETENEKTVEDEFGKFVEAETEETTIVADEETAKAENDETEDSVMAETSEASNEESKPADLVETVDADEPTETEKETVTADSDSSIETGVVDQGEGQELENDIDGTLMPLGTLKGKAYDTVTIWNSANARAYKVSLDEFADIQIEDQIAAMPEMTLEDSTGSMDVSVYAPEGAFPENTTVQAEAVDADEVADAVMEGLYEAGMDIVSIEAADITFYDADGEEIQPESRVEITFDHVDTKTRATRAFVYHMGADGKAYQVAEVDPDAESISFQADEFSVYGVVRTASVQKTMKAMLLANGDDTVSVKIKIDNQDYKSAELPVGVIRDNAGNLEGVDIPADCGFVSAKVGNTEIYAVAVGDEGIYVTTDKNQLAGSKLEDGREITLYYKKSVTEYNIEYKVSVNGGEAITANGSGEVKTTDKKTGATVICTKVIGPAKVNAGESLNFSFSKKDGYIVKGVAYKMGSRAGNLGTGHSSCSIETVTDDVIVNISMEKVAAYDITFHGSNTSFSFGKPDGLKWDEEKQWSEDDSRHTAKVSYTVGSSLDFEVWPNNFLAWSDKFLTRLVITVDGEEAGTDIPQADGEARKTALPNGAVVTIVRYDRTVMNPEDHSQYKAPRYSVRINAAEGTEILGKIDIAANCKSKAEAVSEVRAVSLVGVESLPYHMGEGSLHFEKSDHLNPVTFVFAEWSGIRDFRVFIKVKEGYSTSKKPKVTIEYDGVKEVLDDDEVKPLTGIGSEYESHNNYYGMATAYQNHYQYYFTIPYEKKADDIRIFVTALRDRQQFEVRYDYNGGSDVFGDTRLYVDRGSAETDYEFDNAGGSTKIVVEKGKSVPPTKEGYEFAGWELQRATGKKTIYQPGDLFEAKEADIDGLAELNGSTGNYRYDFVAKWRPIQYVVKITFVDKADHDRQYTVKWKEDGLPGSTVKVRESGLLDGIREKMKEGVIQADALPKGWDQWYEIDHENSQFTLNLAECVDSGWPELGIRYELAVYKVTVTYKFNELDLKEGETTPEMPEDRILSPLKNGESYRVDSPRVDGWVAEPQMVSGRINKSDVAVSVTYYRDANKDGTPDYLQRYRLTITYKYDEKDLKNGEKAPKVPGTYVKSDLKVGAHHEVVPAKVKGWVAVPGKVAVDIYDKDLTREVVYHKDANGDSIPDDYQITITYRVEHGSWNTGANDTITEVLTLRKGGMPAEDGTASRVAPEAGRKPVLGYKAGSWNVAKVPTSFTKADDNTTYTYTYVKNGFKLTVKRVYTAVDGTKTEQAVLDNADIEFEKALSYKADSVDNYTFAGVEVEGLTDTNAAPEIVEGIMPANKVVLTFHYDEDRKGTVDPDKGDGIPDKHQITFTYEAAGKGGEVTGITREVHSLYKKFEKDANGFITASEYAKANPTIPATVTVYDSYYFLNWLDGETIIGSDEKLKEGSYGEDKVFTATFHESPDNRWKVTKDIANIPARGYFRVGEEARFVITVENVGNRALKNIRIKEQQGVAFVSSENYRLENGVAVIDSLDLKEVVKLEAVYKVTRNDLFNRQFRNIVQSTAEFTVVEPGTPEVLKPVTADSGPVPAGAQGSGSGGSGGGGGGSSTRSPGTDGGVAGGPGTVAIDPEEVPLAGVPDMGRVEILALIDDEEDVPLAALPKTGQTASIALRMMLSSMMLAAAAVVSRKREYEQ